MGRKDIRTVIEFDQLIKNNKVSGKHWHHGLEDKWRHKMSESDYRRYIAQLEEEEKALVDKITLASTWNVNCGIATYSRYLLDSLDRIAPNSFAINPINEGVLRYKSTGRLTHLQHEHVIVPAPPGKIKGKLIITWHTVSRKTNDMIKIFESNYDVAAHIVHSECARHDINTSKDIWTVPHGSALIPEMKKEDARKLLGINIDMPIGFVFGFQSGDKNYQRLIDAAINTGIHIIISGAPHIVNSISIVNDANVTFINRFITENEVNFYTLASDILLFDYATKDHYSVSGAMHRIIGAGRPIVCSDIRHFSDVEHDKNCLKFKNQARLEECIRRALENSERLSLAARKYAEKTSWENVAKKHIEI